MDGLAVIGAVFFLIVVGYIGVPAVLRRIPATSLRLPTGPIPDTWDNIVEDNVPLARGLSSNERDRLLRLVQVFLTEKHFEGCGGLTLTEEMKAGEIARPPARVIGESWGDGVVVISWDDTVRGARNSVDGDNVVLHEFAHQLDAEDGVSDGAPILPPSALRTWGGVLSEEYERLRRDAEQDRPSALDEYGATNKAEFFAVATEAFFEKPVQLEREHPALYGQLREFYRQDPARRTPSFDP